MPSLLTLPEELRDRIIEDVLLHQRAAPAYRILDERKRTRAAVDSGHVCAWRYGLQNVRFEQGGTASNATGLLLTDRHIYRQTKDAIARLFPEGANYRLDVMFINEQELWPTWLFVPFVSRKVDTVDVTIRVVGTNSGDNRSAFTIGDGSPPQMVWCFYFLLEHFLEYGLSIAPSAKDSSQRNCSTGVSIKNVNINFTFGDNSRLFPEDTEENRRKWWSRQRQLQSQTLFDINEEELREAQQSPTRMHPRWLATFVAKELWGILGMGYHTAAYGAIVHERVGRIRITCEDDVIREVDLGHFLSLMLESPEGSSEWYTSLTFGHVPGDCRLLTFWNWKYRTVQKRQSLGLSLPEAIIWPTFDEMTSWRRATEKHREEQKAQGFQYYCDRTRCLCADHGLEEMLESAQG